MVGSSGGGEAGGDPAASVAAPGNGAILGNEVGDESVHIHGNEAGDESAALLYHLPPPMGMWTKLRPYVREFLQEQGLGSYAARFASLDGRGLLALSDAQLQGLATGGSTDEVDKAVEMGGEQLDGRPIRIDYAGQKKEKPAWGGGGW